MKAHWLLGQETHFGRGYFALACFESRRDALSEARNFLTLKKSELAALSEAGRVEFSLERARELRLVALELVSCDCATPEVHDG